MKRPIRPVLAEWRPVLDVVPHRQVTGQESADWDDAAHEPAGPSFLERLRPKDAAVEVIVGQGKLLTTKKPLASGSGTAVIAVGDPTVLDFQVMPNPNMIRLVGMRAGVTELSFITADGESVSLEIHVVYDIDLLQAYLHQSFPNAELRLGQVREHLVVEGQARDQRQVAQIIQFLESYVASVQVAQQVTGKSSNNDDSDPPHPVPPGQDEDGADDDENPPIQVAGNERGGNAKIRVRANRAQVINMIRVPGSQQVMLQVRIAELNRTALREVGHDLGYANSEGTILGTKIGGAAVDALSILGGGVSGSAVSGTSINTTAFGIFPDANFEVMLRLLRQNSLLRVLAEPNLIALSGHRANFLAGGEFPVPVPQSSAGSFGTTTVEFREFGVRLEFVPYVLDDGVIRLAVVPEVSSIDFSLGTTLVSGGSPVPGLNTRRAATTVELREGQTLAIAGLLEIELAGNTGRIPGLGDLPYIGPFFSNNSHRSVEKELLVLVSPHLVEPLARGQTVPLPGQCIMEPNDKEFFLLNRIEGRTGRPHRSTVEYEPVMKKLLMDYESACIEGPCGYSR